MSNTEKTTKGYKGFDKDWKCKDFQYKVGETAEMEKGKKLTVCPNDSSKEGGLHFCENPFHVLRYYPAKNGSKYAEVEGIGEALTHKEDSKVATSKLHVKVELGMNGLIKSGLKFVFNKVDTFKKENPKHESIASGNYSTGAASGNYSTGAASGDSSTAKVTGENSIAVAWGANSKASGIKGCYLVLNEWNNGVCIDAKLVKVDGDKIKENVFYKLVDNKIKEA